MACAISKQELMQYADAELAPDRAAALAHHLATCTDCALAVAEALALKRSVRLAGERYMPSANLRRRIETTIAPRRSRRSWVPALAFALMMLLLSAVTVGLLTRRADSNHLISGVIDRHVSALASANPVDVVSTDRHTVKPWFQGKLPFSFNLPELAGTPYTLVGGRVTYLDGEVGAQLIYDVRKHHISVFIFQDREDLARLSDNTTTRRAFSIDSWKSGGLRYIIVADVPQSDVTALVDLLKKSAAQ